MMNDYKTVRLSDYRSANCKVKLFMNGDVCLRSYSTDVLFYVRATGMLYCTGTYSPTTRRHIGWFLREYHYGVGYGDVKRAWENGCKISVRDGLQIPLTESEKRALGSYRYGTTLYPSDFN